MRRIETPFIKGARNPRWERFLDEIFEQATPDVLRPSCNASSATASRATRRSRPSPSSTAAAPTARASSSRPSRASSRASPSQPRSRPSRSSPPAASPTTSQRSRAPASSWPPRASRADRWPSRSSSASRAATLSPRASCVRSSSSSTRPFLIVLATNYKPNFRGPGLRPLAPGQVRPLHPHLHPGDRDAHLTAKFLGRRVPAAAYLPGEDYGDGPAGILAWAVEGAMEWFRDGLQDPAVVAKATEEFKETSDALGRLLRGVPRQGPRGPHHRQGRLDLYPEWSEEEHLPSKERWTRSTFWSALEERGALKVSPGAPSPSGESAAGGRRRWSRTPSRT